MESINVAAHTLGCKVNQCDTEALLTLLGGIGCTICDFNQNADIYIINTCTVTHAGDKKSRQMIRRAKKQNPLAKIAVCGCMVQKNPNLAQDLGIDFVFDARKPDGFVQEIAKLTGNIGINYDRPNNKTRAFLKIQDGCDRFCSYCIVPYVRGKPTSRPMPEILAEAELMLANGALEIVLTGIQVASYGNDIGNDTNEALPQLIKKISSFDGLRRLRLSSIDPWAVTGEFLSAVSNSKVICDHFHLSLQSGSDTVLARMNRRYNTAQYAKATEGLRNILPQAAITADIIVGFPGETDAEFNDSLAFARQIGFAHIHVFEYSRREGTLAADMPNQVPEKIKSERGRAMRELAATLQSDFYKLQTGKTLPVLFESKTASGTWQGHTTNYCPVEIICDNNPANTIQPVEITGYTNAGLTGPPNPSSRA